MKNLRSEKQYDQKEVKICSCHPSLTADEWKQRDFEYDLPLAPPRVKTLNSPSFAAVSENIENSVSIPAEMNLPSPTLVNENSENN